MIPPGEHSQQPAAEPGMLPLTITITVKAAGIALCYAEARWGDDGLATATAGNPGPAILGAATAAVHELWPQTTHLPTPPED